MPRKPPNDRSDTRLRAMRTARLIQSATQNIQVLPGTLKNASQQAVANLLRHLPRPAESPNFWDRALEQVRQASEADLYSEIIASAERRRRSLDEQRAAFEESVNVHKGQFYALAFHLTGNEHDANDLIQTALFEAFRRFYHFEPGTRFDSWVCQIMRNRHIDSVRGLRPEVVSLDQPATQADGSTVAWEPEDPGEDTTRFIEETMSEPLQKALNGLSVDFRRTLILVDVQELSYEEVAGLMSCPVGTVRSRLHRAREALRKALQGPADSKL